MFSKRTDWSFKPNRLAALLAEKRRSGETVLDLTVSNPTRAGLAYPEEEILAASRQNQALTYDPSPFGLENSRKAVARYYGNRGKSVSPNDILLTAGTSEAYAFLFKVLLDPGDQILIPRPSYPLFDYLAALESLEVSSYPLDFDGTWNLDPQAVENAVGPRARAMLVVHPGNPTGSYLKREEADRLVDLCRRRQLALIVDEVFWDYFLEEEPEGIVSLAGEKNALTFVLSGLSKVAGLPQMKLSWIGMSGPKPLYREARKRLEHVSDVFLSVGTPVQQALGSYLELAKQIQPLISARLESNLKLARELTSGSPVDVPHVGGGWNAVLRLPAVQSSEQWALELLLSDNIYVHPGYLFDLSVEACLVVSLLTPIDIFRDAVRRLLRRIEETTNK